MFCWLLDYFSFRVVSDLTDVFDDVDLRSFWLGYVKVEVYCVFLFDWIICGFSGVNQVSIAIYGVLFLYIVHLVLLPVACMFILSYIASFAGRVRSYLKDHSLVR